MKRPRQASMIGGRVAKSICYRSRRLRLRAFSQYSPHAVTRPEPTRRIVPGSGTAAVGRGASGPICSCCACAFPGGTFCPSWSLCCRASSR